MIKKEDPVLVEFAGFSGNWELWKKDRLAGEGPCRRERERPGAGRGRGPRKMRLAGDNPPPDSKIEHHHRIASLRLYSAV